MRVHWFAFTFFGARKEFDAFYQELLAPTFGIYKEEEHGGRGYRTLATTGVGVRLYFDPISKSSKGDHCHIEIPGDACDCLIPDVFREMMTYLALGRWEEGILRSDLFSVKRLDLAFDEVPFTPEQWFEAVSGPNVVTLAKREKIRVDNSPFALRDNGELGSMTVYLGTNDSDRMVRVYNKRGFTRLEFQTRDDRAHMVALDVLLSSPTRWHEKALSHVVQYVSFEGDIPAWWNEFLNSIQSADLIISAARVVSLNRLDSWIKKQVKIPLSVLYEIQGEDYIKGLMEEAKKQDRTRYQSLLELSDHE